MPDIIKGFAYIIKYLTELTRKIEWRWDIEKQGVFEKLKKRMTTATVLAIPDNKHKFWMEVDVLEYAISEVLSQQQTDSFWWPIAFMFQVLNKIEINYKIYDWELLAIITGLKL